MIPSFAIRSLRTKILLIFLILSIVSLAVTGFVAFQTIGSIGESARMSSTALGKDAVRDSSAALTNATEGYMLRMATDQANLIDEIFWETGMEINILASQALSIQNNPAYVPRIPSFPPGNPPADPRSGTLVLIAPQASVSASDEEYRSLAGMDDLIASVYHSDGDLVAVYVVTSSGILRAYPWQQIAGTIYDPRTRPWYTAALASQETVWTAPYVDAAGHGLIVTCARQVPTKFGTWVVASDVTIDQLNAYTSMSMAGNGYAVIIDSNGTVISRPGLSAESKRWDQAYVPENILHAQSSELSSAGRNMTAGKTGIERITLNGNRTLVAYAPIQSLNWSYAIFMPESEVVRPILVTEGRIIEATLETSEEIRAHTDRVTSLFLLLFILLLIIIIVLSWLLARVITRPVEALKDGAAAIGGGDLKYRVDIHSGDEFEDLGRSFNRMAADLKSSIENLKTTTAEKERYAKEMEIAREIQESFLPETVPHIPGYGIAAVNTPAMEIGGDLYDFIPAGTGRQGFVIADVSGKGASAALYMALSHTLLHASGEADPDPSGAVKKANRLLFDDGRSSMFITVFYGILDAGSRTFTYVNAGHNPPLLVKADGTAVWLDHAKGIALGVIDDVAIPPATIGLSAGDTLVLYTDGVTEAFNEKDEYFGEDRLMETVLRARSLGAGDILDAVVADIRTFAGTAPQSDDITLVVIRVG